MEVDSTAAVIIEEKNADWDFNIPFINKNSKTKKHHGNLCVGGFGFGVVNAMDAPEGMNVDMGSSYELSLDHLLRFNYNILPTTSVSMGFGMTWRNYRMTGRTRFIKEGDKLACKPLRLVVIGEHFHELLELILSFFLRGSKQFLNDFEYRHDVPFLGFAEFCHEEDGCS